MSFPTSSGDVNRASKKMLTELLGYPDGVQASEMAFFNSTDSNRQRAVQFLEMNGYIKVLDTNGQKKFGITDRGCRFLKWATVHC